MIAMLVSIPFLPYLMHITPDEEPIYRLVMFVQAITIPFSVIAMSTIYIVRTGGSTAIAIYVNVTTYVAKIAISSFIVWLMPKISGRTPNEMFAFIDSTRGALIFVFLMEKSLEIGRFIIGITIYKRKNWVKNIAIAYN
jgi:hypothetical protein